MTDDTGITDRLRKLAEDTDDDMYGQTIVLDDADIMETREMKRLLHSYEPPDDDETE